MHRLIVLALLVLMGCGHPPQPAPPAFRDPDAPIYSSAVIETARLEGSWVQVAGFAEGPVPCDPGRVDITPGMIRWALCLDAAQQGAGPMVPGKPGRFAVDGMRDWWVLWVDGDYRTMVIGTPSGGFGFVLNRDAALPGDRVKAVRDIFAFNGYDIDKLRFY